MGDGGNLPIGPGFGGFVAFFVMALALWLLVRNMNGRLRRMAYRERDRAGTTPTEAPRVDPDPTSERGEGPTEPDADGPGLRG